MIPEKLLAKCKELKIVQERCKEEDYYEFVVFAKDLDEWNSVLCQFFGPPSKAAGKEANKEFLDMTKNYGSIRQEQILYKKDYVETVCIAILWMWKDGVHMTLKIASYDK